MSSSKQKLVLSIVCGFLILAIIGLSIGIVLVANKASIGASMSVSYKATNVACTISSVAQIYGNEDKKIGDELKPTPEQLSIYAADSESMATSGLMEYHDEIVLVGGGEYVVFTLSVKNDATDAVGAHPIMAEAEMIEMSTNILIVVDDKDAEVINPQDTGVITITMTIIDPNQEAHFEGSVKLTITQVQTVNN